MRRRLMSATVVGGVVVAALQLGIVSESVASAGHGPGDSAKAPAGPLSSRLAMLAGSAQLRGATAGQQARALSLPAKGAGSLMRRGDRVMVEVRVAHTSAATVAGLRAAGARITHVSRHYSTVTALVAPSSLRAVGDARGVTTVHEVLTPQIARGGLTAAGTGPQTSATCPQGSATSEGDSQLRADLERAQLGGTGKGVTVGVISDSYDRWAGAPTHAAQDVASGDLPGPGNPCGSTTPVNVVDDSDTTGEDEGRAMLQVVHDLAPDANLSFATALTSETAFADNIRKLAAQGATVIVDDVTYFDEPFYQDGPVAQAVNDVTAQGVVYYSSAANNNIVSAGKNVASYEAPAFRATPCPTGVPGVSPQCMNFSTTGTDNTYGISVANNGYLLLEVQWAQPWYGVTTDLDAYLLSTGGTVLATSNDRNVTSTQEPFEIFEYTNTTGATQNVNLAISRFTGAGGGNTGTPRVKVAFLENGRTSVVPNEYTTSTGGDVVGPVIFGHNGAANTMSVAAVPYNNSAAPEYYSSRGPVTQYFGPVVGTTPAAPLASPLVLAKPDIAATDCAVTTFFASALPPYRFCGTSEAAPHAAAVAALEKSLNPGITRAALIASQKSTARPVGAYGASDVGSGLIDALGATDAVTSRLSVAFAGTGTGSVASSDGKVSCGASCSSVLPIGATETLVATPGAGSYVTWTGCDSVSGNQCTVGLGTDRSVTATFTKDVTAPTARLGAPAKNLQFGRRISLAWSGDDAGQTGVRSFNVQVRKARYNHGFGHWTAVKGLTGTTATTGSVRGSYGTTYCFRVQATDNAGNVSGFAAQRCVQLPVDDKQMKASTGWTRKSGQHTPSHTLSVTKRHGATLTLKNVHAKRVGLVFRTCKGCGTVVLSFDGKKKLKVNLSQRHAHNRYVLAKSFAKAKTGTLKVRVVSHHRVVQIDGVIASRTTKVTAAARRLRSGVQQ